MKILYWYSRAGEMSYTDLFTIKPDGTYMGGAEISTIKYINELRQRGHLVDYNRATQDEYDAIVFIWRPIRLDIPATKKFIRPVNPYGSTKEAIYELRDYLHGITCPSDYLMRECTGLGVPLFKHPLGVCRSLLPRSLPPRDGNSFSYANSIHPRKGTDIALEAFYAALQENRNLKLHIYGDEYLWGTDSRSSDNPVFYEKVAEWIARIPKDNLILHGNIPHVQLLEELGKHRAHLVPSRVETGSSSTLEAQAVGTPVIALDACSLPEYCGQGGMVVSESVDAWTSAILRMANDDEFWQHASAVGLERSQLWTMEQSADTLECILRESVRTPSLTSWDENRLVQNAGTLKASNAVDTTRGHSRPC